MKSPFFFLLLALPLFAQGPLQPPSTANPAIGPINPLASGNPQPTMKTLHQVEPRIPLTAGSPGVSVSSGGNITISAPGSYYLTGNVTVSSGDGIFYSAADGRVTIDLNGFSISSTANPPAGNGVFISGLNQISTIKNGAIYGAGTVSSTGFSGSGFSKGIDTYSGYQSVISGIQVNGVSDRGIFTDSFSESASTLVENCTVRNCGGIGISSTLIDKCVASQTFGIGLSGRQIMNSVGRSWNDHGISGSSVSQCFGRTLAPGTVSVAGIWATIVTNSTGEAANGGSTRSIMATTAVACFTNSTANIANKYNMP